MKSAIALIFFACIAGSMANNIGQIFMGQVQQHASSLFGNVMVSVQEALAGLLAGFAGQANQLIGTLGGRFFDFQAILNQALSQVQQQVTQLVPSVLTGLMGSLNSLISGSRGAFDDFQAILSGFYESIQGSLAGLGNHLLNQGLSAVLGGLAGRQSRIFGDLFASLQESVSGMLSQAGNMMTGVMAGLQGAAAGILSTAQPHWEDLQQQLLGHGMNVLGSVSETINNMHGSLVGGR
ncbi:unnamed protein product [Adineta steineri]|uniref:Uncharacterized protein n=1 Tax=Adineta steineri TaxID=433720 RepID=A0A819KWE6_9BILA|nr:unnamed protein product [Adineta steineri]